MTDIERGFRRIFWGFILVVLDFRIERLDLLPDFVGYALITAGLGLLVGLQARFRMARTLAAILIVLALPRLVELETGGGQGVTAWMIYALVVDVLDVAMVWLLCGGIIAVALRHGLESLAGAAAVRRALYLGLTLLFGLLGLALREPVKVEPVFVVCLVVTALVIVVLMVTLMSRAGRELADAPDEMDEDDRFAPMI